MTNLLTIKPIKYVNGVVNLPGSKSITNRALILASQSIGVTKLSNILNSDDTYHMLLALKKIGVNFNLSKNYTFCELEGIGNNLFFKNKMIIYLGNAGTAIRPLTALFCLSECCNVILTGDSRMQERPIENLVNALRQGGAKIDYISRKGFPPIMIRGGFKGGDIQIKGNISSQFITSLLMIMPLAHYNSRIIINGNLVSKPYIDTTLSIMNVFGVKVYHNNYKTFYVSGNNTYYSPGEYFVEGDASSASYFLSAALICGGTIRVNGLGCNSIQGDMYFADVLEYLGAKIYWGINFIECTYNFLRPVNIDVNYIPDAAMTLAIIAIFTNNGTTTLRNIYNWRIKETDRLRDMSIELKKIGATVINGEDWLSITSSNKFKNYTTINTYNDHRIAMCFSLVSLSNILVSVLNPKCVNKTFPNFFDQLNKISYFK